MSVFIVLAVVLSGAALLRALHRRARDAVSDGVARAREELSLMFSGRPIRRRVLPRRLLDEALRTRTVGVRGDTILPGRITISANPSDLEPFSIALSWLSEDIESGLRDEAAENNWRVIGELSVSIVADPSRPIGRPRATGRLHADTAAPTNSTTPFREPTAVLDPTIMLMSDSGGAPIELRFNGDLITIGRTEGADLTLSDPQVSREHCRLRRVREGVEVHDLKSRNGTFVDGSRVTRAVLGDGSRLTVGASTYRVAVDHRRSDPAWPATRATSTQVLTRELAS